MSSAAASRGYTVKTLQGASELLLNSKWRVDAIIADSSQVILRQGKARIWWLSMIW